MLVVRFLSIFFIKSINSLCGAEFFMIGIIKFSAVSDTRHIHTASRRFSNTSDGRLYCSGGRFFIQLSAFFVPLFLVISIHSVAGHIYICPSTAIFIVGKNADIFHNNCVLAYTFASQYTLVTSVYVSSSSGVYVEYVLSVE
jgi:hypothetical protein